MPFLYFIGLLLAMFMAAAMFFGAIKKIVRDARADLLESLKDLIVKYDGTLNDPCSLQDLRAEIGIDGIRVHIQTIIIRRRKDTDEYAVRISARCRSCDAIHERVMAVKDTADPSEILRTVSSMLPYPNSPSDG